MFARLFGARRERASPGLRRALTGFRETASLVEDAKAALLTAVPSSRGSVVPLAQALAAYESRLRAATSSMAGWRAAEVEGVWLACHDALGEALRQAESLRLGEPPQDYEHAYGPLGDLLEPLEAFAAAGRRLRELRS